MATSTVQCINCSLRLAPFMRRILVADNPDNITNFLRAWIFPTKVSPEDVLCKECFMLLQNAVISQEPLTPAIGHRSVCYSCGVSTLRSRTHTVSPNCRQRKIILLRIPQHQVKRLEKVCHACWLAANREMHRQHHVPHKLKDQHLQVTNIPNPQEIINPAIPIKIVEHQPPPDVMLDHSYCFQNGSSPSSMEFSVKVEDEGSDKFTDNIEGEDTTINSLNGPSLSPNISKETCLQLTTVAYVNHDKMYRIADRIACDSSNIADKILSIELKNTWGNVLKEEEKEDSYNELVQNALRHWGNIDNDNFHRESPLFYQCHICELAWWNLHPFQDHIKKHHNDEWLKVYYQENSQVSIIVASLNFTHEARYIPCDGPCPRCGETYEWHERKQDMPYKCDKCSIILPTCSSLKQHESICSQVQQWDMKAKCTICHAEFLSKKDLCTHLTVSHTVRSDHPVLFTQNSCPHCHRKYHCSDSHMCPNSLLIRKCVHCFRKFKTNISARTHLVTPKEPVKCQCCHQILPRKCLEIQHMLSHTDKFRLAYQCMSKECPSTMVFLDEYSLRTHTLHHHQQIYNTNNLYCEMVLIPEQCTREDVTNDLDLAAARKDLNYVEAPIEESTQENQLHAIKYEDVDQLNIFNEEQETHDDDAIGFNPDDVSSEHTDTAESEEDELFTRYMQELAKESNNIDIARNKQGSYSPSYRWCAVPKCKNTSVTTPNKLWILLPADIVMRKIWFELARRDSNRLLKKSRLYFCEDHFDLENDMVNYRRYKIMGSVKKIQMKPECVPSRFPWNTKHTNSNISHFAEANSSKLCESKQNFIEVPLVTEESACIEEQNFIKEEPPEEDKLDYEMLIDFEGDPLNIKEEIIIEEGPWGVDDTFEYCEVKTEPLEDTVD